MSWLHCVLDLLHLVLMLFWFGWLIKTWLQSTPTPSKKKGMGIFFCQFLKPVLANWFVFKHSALYTLVFLMHLIRNSKYQCHASNTIQWTTIVKAPITQAKAPSSYNIPEHDVLFNICSLRAVGPQRKHGLSGCTLKTISGKEAVDHEEKNTSPGWCSIHANCWKFSP